jgi:hypothetical protein
VELRGFEPLTSSMPWKRATNCAIAPCVGVARRPETDLIGHGSGCPNRPDRELGIHRDVAVQEVEVVGDSLLERFTEIDVEVTERVDLDLAVRRLLGVAL